MVDRTLVLKKLATLEEYRQQLTEFTSLTVADYRSDWKVQRIVECTLQMMIELCADVAGHLIADRRWRTPETYADNLWVRFRFLEISSRPSTCTLYPTETH